MRKIIFIIFFLPFLCQAAQGDILSETDLERWYGNYYLSPAPDEAVNAVLYYGESSLFEKESTRGQFAVFIATILKDRQDLIDGIYQEISLKGSENSKIFFLNVLWFLDSERSREFIKKAETDWLSVDVIETSRWLLEHPTFDPLIAPIDSPGHLDLLWSIFLATGKKEPVVKIISALAYLDEKDANHVLIGGAARWSLGSNAKTHKVIGEICKEELSKSKANTKKYLKEIIKGE